MYGRMTCFSLPASAKSLDQNPVIARTMSGARLSFAQNHGIYFKSKNLHLMVLSAGFCQIFVLKSDLGLWMYGAVSLFAQNLGIYFKSGENVKTCFSLPAFANSSIKSHTLLRHVWCSLSSGKVLKSMHKRPDVLFGGTFKIINITNIFLNTHSNKTLASFSFSLAVSANLSVKNLLPPQSCSASSLLSK